MENFLPVENFFCQLSFCLPDEHFFVGLYAGQRAFSRQNASRGINNMASSDRNPAGSTLRQILGRISDLSTAIDQQGSSLSSGRAPQITTSVESKVRKVFGADHQAPSSTSSASFPVVSASQSGPLYTMRRNFTNFRTANYRSSRGGKRKGATPSGSFLRDVILLSSPNDVPRQGNRVFLQESGHVIMAFPFKKEWSDLEVELKIREAFQDMIPRLVDFKILQSVHTKLSKPTLAQGQYLTGAMIHRIFRDKPIYVRPMRQILKPPKQRKTHDDLDEHVDNEFEVTNGNLELLSSTRAAGEKATVTLNFPSVPHSLLHSCSDNNATDAVGSALSSTSGSAPTSYDEMNAVNSSEQNQQPLPNAYDDYIGALYESSPDEDADLLAAIYASIEDQKRSSTPAGEKEVDVVRRKFIDDNLQPEVKKSIAMS